MPNNILQYNSWIIKQVKNILERVKDYPQDRSIILETGYGPSGLPHLGTIAEILRTYMIKKVLKEVQSRPVRLISMVDDFDALRKVPSNIINGNMMAQYIGQPVCQIPDPYGCCNSFAQHNTKELQKLIDKFGLTDEVETISSAYYYKQGVYNETLKHVLHNYEAIKEVICKNIGKERQQTYSPFMPISPVTNYVIQNGVIGYNLNDYTIQYIDQDGTKRSASIFNGECKLQFKVDIGMRWTALKIDYEIYGKDLIDLAKAGTSVSKILSNNCPLQMVYELFVDLNGKKMSKSKGNGISLDEWLTYSPLNTITHFLASDPRRVRTMDINELGKYIDTYINDLNKEHITPNDNIYYVHGTNIPYQSKYEFSMLLNLAQGSQANNIEQFIKFLDNKNKLNNFEKELAQCAFNYFKQYRHNPQYITTPNWMFPYISGLLNIIENNFNKDEIKNYLFNSGKNAIINNYVLNMTEWCKIWYQIMFGYESGPRLVNYFIYDKENSINILKKLIPNN